MKKQAQPFAAAFLGNVTLRLQSFLVWSAIFQFRYPFQQLLHYGATGTALACSGVKWANRGGVYLFFLPDSS